jgi:hypothetical protein
MIRVRWEHKTRTVVFSCGVFAEKSKWDSDLQKAQKNTVHTVKEHSFTAREINAAISEVIDVIGEAFDKFSLTSTSPFALELKEYVQLRMKELHPKVEKKSVGAPTIEGLFHLRSLSSVFDEFIKDCKDSMKWRGNYSEYHYRQVRNNINDCISASELYDSITIGDVDARFLNELKRWCVNKGYLLRQI